MYKFRLIIDLVLLRHTNIDLGHINTYNKDLDVHLHAILHLTVEAGYAHPIFVKCAELKALEVIHYI